MRHFSARSFAARHFSTLVSGVVAAVEPIIPMTAPDGFAGAALPYSPRSSRRRERERRDEEVLFAILSR